MSNIIKKITVIDENGTVQKRIGSLGSDVSYDNSSSGLTTSNMQAVVDELVGGSSYAVCSTEGATAAKTVSITNFALRAGVKAVIKFTYDNTAANPTLNISNTGAKSLIANGASAEDAIKENSVFLVTYNGTNYELVGGVGGLDGFVGTRNEWEALGNKQSKYEGKLIYITDDYDPSSGGGHIITDKNGDTYPHRNKLQFLNADIIDDSQNNSTIVDITNINTTSIIEAILEVLEDGYVTEEEQLLTSGNDNLVTSDGDNLMLNNTQLISETANAILKDVYYTLKFLNGISIIDIVEEINKDI